MLKKFFLIGLVCSAALLGQEATTKAPVPVGTQTASVPNSDATQNTATSDPGTAQETTTQSEPAPAPEPIRITEEYIKDLYKSLGISGYLDYSVFKRGFLGYISTPEKRSGILTIIDFTKPSNEDRFFVLDLDNKALKYHTLVTHGKNSGLIIPVQFSNTRNSYQSSLGFYKTAEAYTGDYGYSLRLDGLEEGFNSNARVRAIVIHGAKYASQDYIDSTGFLGRTSGCPALPLAIAPEIIDFLKDGTILFIYGNDNKYLERSKYGKI